MNSMVASKCYGCLSWSGMVDDLKVESMVERKNSKARIKAERFYLLRFVLLGFLLLFT